MKLICVAIFIGLLVTSPAAEEFEARIYNAPDGQSLPYRLLTPKNYDPAQTYPLVLLLHGAGERGTDNSAQLKYSFSQRGNARKISLLCRSAAMSEGTKVDRHRLEERRRDAGRSERPGQTDAGGARRNREGIPS
jgi:fermentation-respiration switch protein FrsA (DUF1100 family)